MERKIIINNIIKYSTLLCPEEYVYTLKNEEWNINVLEKQSNTTLHNLWRLLRNQKTI